MDMYAEQGHKVVFIGEGGMNHDKEKSEKYLTVGKTYTVKRTKVFGWISYVILEEFPDEEFNTVMFIDLDDDDEELCEEIEDRLLNDNGKRFTSKDAIERRKDPFRFKIICNTDEGQEVFAEYRNVDEVISDMKWRDPSMFFICDELDKKGYTLDEFIKKFRGKDNE